MAISQINWELWANIGQAISGLLAVLGFLWCLIKAFKNFIKPIYNHFIKIIDLADKIDQSNKNRAEYQQQMTKKLDKVFYQVSPNGGGSIKDVVTKLSTQVQIISDELLSQKQRRKIKDFNSQFPIFQINKQGDCTWSNKSMQMWTGRTQEELNGRGWTLTVCEEERNEIEKQWEHAINEERQVEINYNIYNPTNNEKTHVYCRGHLIKDNKGNLKNYVVVLTKENDQLDNDVSGMFNSTQILK